jgi:hypothetical protein
MTERSVTNVVIGAGSGAFMTGTDVLVDGGVIGRMA